MLRVDSDYFGAKIAQNKRKQDSSRPSFLSPILQRHITKKIFLASDGNILPAVTAGRINIFVSP